MFSVPLAGDAPVPGQVLWRGLGGVDPRGGGCGRGAAPDRKAPRDLRRRVGAAPVKALFEVLSGPSPWPRLPGVRFGLYRTVSFDGCQSVKVPDTPANRRWLGKPAIPAGGKAGKTGAVEAAYPAIWLMTLVETGTRALLGAVFGPRDDGEIAAASQLLHLLDDSMLVLAGRGFDAGGFMAAIGAARAQFLIRLKSIRHPPVLARLPDGSVLSVIDGVRVRLITATVTVTCQDGTRYGGSYRLATTLTDHRAYPATALTALYHERWEHKITYLALRHPLLHGRVLRSGTPACLNQEMWALLALCQALRIAVTDAIATVPGTDPDRASRKTAVQAAQELVITAEGIIADGSDLAGGIGRAVLAALNPHAACASAHAKSEHPSAAGKPTRPADLAPASTSPPSPPISPPSSTTENSAARNPGAP